MSDISPIHRAAGAAYPLNGSAPRGLAAAPAATRGDDRVELSTTARLLSDAKDPPIRQGLVDRVRAEIASGTYETPEKLEQAAEALLSDFAELSR